VQEIISDLIAEPIAQEKLKWRDMVGICVAIVQEFNAKMMPEYIQSLVWDERWTQTVNADDTCTNDRG
jgi:hypothetical protein